MTALPTTVSRFRWIAAGVMLVAVLALAWAWHIHTTPQVFRVLLLDPELRADAGLDLQECAAINELVKDQLEIAAGASVSQTLGVPGPRDWPGFNRQALILRLAPRRAGARLELRATWARVSDLQQAKTWNHPDDPGGAPASTIEALIKALPLPRSGTSHHRLLPLTPGDFWGYIGARGNAHAAGHESTQKLLETCAAAQPDCATIPIAQGEFQFFQALQASSNDIASLLAAESFLKRGLELSPHHPRGTWLLSRLYTDTGRAKEALELLIEARRAHPNAIPPIIGITYAARYAGLLDFAAAAETRTDRLSVDPAHPVRLQVTFLYRGDWSRYERTLWIRPGSLSNTTVLLLRGQLQLARGRRDAALETFREVSESPEGYVQFIRLGRVFRLILEADPAAARRDLDMLAQSRVGLRVPDGEFILHMAEAYALLGEHHRAQDLAEKAFYAGFTCARWYETNPLLQPLRGTPRWTALVQHVKERQAILEARFPPGRWGL